MVRLAHAEQRRLGLALAAVILAAITFVRIAEGYLTNDALARWDVRFALWLSEGRHGLATDVFHAVTRLGSTAAAFVIATVGCIALYRRSRLAEAGLLLVAIAGGGLLNLVLKLSFQRPRPEVAIVDLDTYSFPSGHAMISTAAYGALAYLTWSHLRTRPARLLLLGGAAVLVGLICFSRLYLGVHYLSDVLAGSAGGVFWLAVSIALQTTYGERFATRFAGSRADRLGRRLTRSERQDVRGGTKALRAPAPARQTPSHADAARDARDPAEPADPRTTTRATSALRASGPDA